MTTPGTRYTEKEKRNWVKMYEGGMSVSEICRKQLVNRSTVTRWLKKYGVNLKGASRMFDRKAILDDIKSGMPQVQVAKKHGCSQRLVSDIATGKVGV